MVGTWHVADTYSWDPSRDPAPTGRPLCKVARQTAYTRREWAELTEVDPQEACQRCLARSPEFAQLVDGSAERAPSQA